MKKLFFMLVMASSMALFAQGQEPIDTGLPEEQVIDQDVGSSDGAQDNLLISGKKWGHHRHAKKDKHCDHKKDWEKDECDKEKDWERDGKEWCKHEKDWCEKEWCKHEKDWCEKDWCKNAQEWCEKHKCKDSCEEQWCKEAKDWCCKKKDGCEGILDQYGSFYTEAQTLVIAPSTPIPFNLTSVATGGVDLNPGGLIILREKGDYFVNFGAAIETPAVATAAIALNGVFPQPGSQLFLTPTNGSSLITLSTIIHVTECNSTISVVNSGAAAFTLGTASTGDVTAFITIEKLHDLPTPIGNNDCNKDCHHAQPVL